MSKDASQIISELAHAEEYRYNIRELLGYMMSARGGALRVAEDFWKEYDAARPGSPTRAQMLSNFMKLLGSYGDTEDESDLSTPEEIEALARQVLKELDE